MKKVIFLTNLVAMSAVLGMQNNFAESNRDPSKNPMRPVNANDLQMVSYESLTDRDWISKIVHMNLKGEDFNAPQNADKQTILMCATKYANSKIMQQILNVKDSKGNRVVDINAKDRDENTALSIAAETGDKEKILLLLTNGADVEAEFAGKKLSGKKKKLLKVIYEEVFGTNVRVEFCKQVCHGNLQKVKSLLESNTIDVNQGNPLIIAMIEGYKEIVELLLEQPDIDVNLSLDITQLGIDNDRKQMLLKQNLDVITPLGIAVERGYKEIVELLLKHPGIDVNKQLNNGATALIIAAEKGRDEIVELLLNHPDINVNEPNKYGETALITAAEKGH